MTRQVSKSVRQKIGQWEGLRLDAYQDSVGVWTIGYGHTKGVKKGDRITQAQADKYLTQDLREAEAAVDRLVEVDLNDNQFGALVSFVFNTGIAAFAGSTLLKLLNKGQYASVPAQLARWNKGTVNGRKVVLRGLSNRRAAEAGLWVSGDHVSSGFVEPLKPVPVSRSKAGVGTAMTGAGAIGATLTDAASQTSLMVDYGMVFSIMFALLMTAGIGFTIWGLVQNHREGST